MNEVGNSRSRGEKIVYYCLTSGTFTSKYYSYNMRLHVGREEIKEIEEIAQRPEVKGSKNGA